MNEDGGLAMKAVIEIELEIDGEWEADDKDRLCYKIANSMPFGWEIDEDRLVVMARTISVKLKGQP